MNCSMTENVNNTPKAGFGQLLNLAAFIALSYAQTRKRLYKMEKL